MKLQRHTFRSEDVFFILVTFLFDNVQQCMDAARRSYILITLSLSFFLSRRVQR